MNIDFKALLALSPNPYMVLDPDLTIVWTNAAYRRSTMRSEEDLVGTNVLDAFPSEPGSESHELLVSSFARVLKEKKPDEIALIRYDIARPDGSMEPRYWSATHTPILNENGEVSVFMQHTVDVTEMHNLRTMRDEFDLVRRAEAVQTRNLDLQTQMKRMTATFEQAPGFVCLLSGPHHVFEIANAAYCELVGRQNLLGKTVAEALPEVVRQGFVDILDNVRRGGQPYIGHAQEIVFESGPDGAPVRRYIDFIYQPIVSQDKVSTILVQGQDVTETVLAARQQDLLINELNHRVKNTLAIVQSLAHQSFRHIPGAGAAREAFDTRLRALARAHNLLTEAAWQSSALSEVIREATAPCGDPARIEVEGPEAWLSPRLTVALSMTLHELTTNAIKYGALSNDRGRVRIRWQRAPEAPHAMTLEWSEEDGPVVEIPAHKGFGTRLIEGSMAAEYGGSVVIDYLPTGVHCTMGFMVPVAPPRASGKLYTNLPGLTRPSQTRPGGLALGR
ncbi:HWE histidine kinase domain-containing protein [Novosphingobium sp. BW1]|uniref:HWE histidine kinase domain-containing protein n=1 Tax=Novosphingobium sp. BW1 TaxID=2592621 RepID=UPI0011DEB30B|nr:HWE histidine kinase domain-containing protein [Novosphingobium sp. BW1]TYC91694.1 PAS domain-containing protein [Novosphingobium sp. BW1]